MIIANYKKIVPRKDNYYLSAKTLVFVKYNCFGRAPSGEKTGPSGSCSSRPSFFKYNKKKDVCFDHSRGVPSMISKLRDGR